MILQAVSASCGVKEEDLVRRSFRHVGRPLLMKLLVEIGGLSGREVAQYLGLGSSAAVSRHLRALEERRKVDLKLNQLLQVIRKPLG